MRPAHERRAILADADRDQGIRARVLSCGPRLTHQLYSFSVRYVRLKWYTVSMKVTTTEFRKNMFQLVERVLQGELVEIVHKGRLVRLVPEVQPTKMSRLVQRDTINGTPEDLALAQQELDDEMRTAWTKKWIDKRT